MAPSCFVVPWGGSSQGREGSSVHCKLEGKEKKKVDLHVKFIINLGSRFFFFVCGIKEYSDLSWLLRPGLATGICYFHLKRFKYLFIMRCCTWSVSDFKASKEKMEAQKWFPMCNSRGAGGCQVSTVDRELGNPWYILGQHQPIVKCPVVTETCFGCVSPRDSLFFSDCVFSLLQ